MRNIPKKLKEEIVSIFPLENTLALIVFGSYGTSKQHKGSDIDIAWVPKAPVSILELSRKTESLKLVCPTEVDLKIVTENYTALLIKNIIEGDLLYEDKDFYMFYNDFMREQKDTLDIVLGDEFYGMW